MSDSLQPPTKEDLSKSLAPGTRVFCTYRMRSQRKKIWKRDVGVIEEPGTDPAAWNTTNSEAYYCKTCQVARVRYEWGVQHDSIAALVPLTPEQRACVEDTGPFFLPRN